MKWEAISLEEQETIINIDYFEKTLNLFTTRSIVYKKLLKKIGEPMKTHISYNHIYGADWRVPFDDRKKIRNILTLANLIMTKERELENSQK